MRIFVGTARLNRFLLLCGLALSLSFSVFGDDARQTEQQLERLRNQIKTLRLNMEKDLGERDRLRQRVKQAEENISNIQNRISQLEQDQSATRERLKQLDLELGQQKKQMQEKSHVLAAQLKSAYIGGNQQSLKLLLNVEDPVSLARVMTYYGFLSRHKTGQIREIRQEIQSINRLDQAVSETLAKQEVLRLENESQLQAMQSARQKRAEALAAIESRISDKDDEVQRLSQQEKALVKLLEELKDLLAEYPVQTEEAFAGFRGRLQWPLPGKLLHDFGQPRAARIPWRGVVIGAPMGTPVRAIARGRVSYADWLPGMGLLLILDHGGGFMSLYGYNQTLSRSLGDWVGPGDILARVGDTGGQFQPTLYFEIRQSGKPLNPHKWFKSGISKSRNDR